MSSLNIYLICTGNTCRSPMAEAILRSKGLHGVNVRSAGIHALDGQSISGHAQTLIQEANMPFTPVSRALTIEDVEWADVILTMTEAHRSALSRILPEAANRIYTLKNFVQPDSDGDVLDPFGGNLDTYRRTFEELAHIMNKLELKLLEGQA